MNFLDLFGHTFLALVAISGAAGARLQKIGAMPALAKSSPLRFYAAVLISVANLLGIFYFSWQYFAWPQWLTLLAVSIMATPLAQGLTHRTGLWLGFALPGALVLAAECLLIFS